MTGCPKCAQLAHPSETLAAFINRRVHDIHSEPARYRVATTPYGASYFEPSYVVPSIP